MGNITDSMKEFFERIRDERTMHANTANRIGNAFLMILNYLLDSDTPFLRKDREDATRYLLTLLAGAVIGESGRIRLNPDGSIICDSIKVNSSAIFDELVFNHQNVLEGDTFFTNRGVIERVEPLNEGRYRVFLRKEYQDEIITFQQNDILKCSMNNLDTGHTFKNSWMRVNTVDTETNSMDVVLYANNEVPGGANYAPVPGSVIIRWGNADETKTERQSCWYISSTEKRIVMLDGVTKPKLEERNYASFYGLPFEMENFKGYMLNKNQPYLYVRGAFLQDVCFIDYLGKVVKQERYRGVWSQEVANSNDPYKVTQTTFDTVYHKNAKWQCNSTIGSKVEPSESTTDWTKLSEGGKGSDGKTTYVHIKYSNDGGKTFTDPNGETVGEWIGVCTNFYKDAPTSVSDYTWSKIKGDNGKNGANAPRVLYFNSDTRPATPTSKNPSGWGSIPLRPVAVSNMRAEKTSRADYSFGKVENAVHKEYWASLNKGIYNSIAEALIYFDADNDGTVRFDWYAACGSANKASIYKVNSQVDTVVWNIDGYKTGVYDATVKKGTNFIRVCYEKGEKNIDEDRLFIRVLDTSTSRRIWVVTEILTSDGEYAGWSDPVQWTGNDGRNLTKVTNYYKWGTSGVDAPSEPYAPDTIPTHVEGSDYLWNYEVCSDDNEDTISQSGKTCIGYFPKDGDPGKGIKSITEYYQIGTEEKPTNGITVNSNNELDTTGWKTTMDPTTNENRFVWNQEVIQFTDGTYSISVIHLAGAQGDQGVKGDKGEDAKRIYLESELPFIAMTNNGIPKDARYYFSVYARLEHLTGTVKWEVVFKQGVDEIDIPYGEEDTYRYNGNELIIEDSEVIVSMYGVDTIIITATLGNYKAQITIPVIYDGDNGEDGKDGRDGTNGKPLVGPTEWKAGVRYLAGKSNEAYQSLVINPKYPKQMFLCGYSHRDVEPVEGTFVTSVSSCSSKKPWVSVAYQDFVATKVLFAERGKIENLDITNATIQGTVTDIAVSTKDDWDKITDKCYKTADEEYYFGKYSEDGRRFQIVVPDKAGSYFIPTLNKYGNSTLTETKIVFLPAIRAVSVKAKFCESRDYDEYIVPAYKKAGTHINITMGASYKNYSRWAYLSDDSYKYLWLNRTSGKLNALNRDTVCNIYNQGVLICADPLIFRSGENNGHIVTGDNFYTRQSDYIHGRFSLNGASARMIWLMPGQTLQLISQIEKDGQGNECLVWNITNASDFSAVKMNLRFSTEYKTDGSGGFKYSPITFPGSQKSILTYDSAGSDGNWCDDIFAHPKLDIDKYKDSTVDPPFLHFYKSIPDVSAYNGKYPYPDVKFEKKLTDE